MESSTYDINTLASKPLFKALYYKSPFLVEIVLQSTTSTPSTPAAFRRGRVRRQATDACMRCGGEREEAAVRRTASKVREGEEHDGGKTYGILARTRPSSRDLERALGRVVPLSLSRRCLCPAAPWETMAVREGFCIPHPHLPLFSRYLRRRLPFGLSLHLNPRDRYPSYYIEQDEFRRGRDVRLIPLLTIPLPISTHATSTASHPPSRTPSPSQTYNPRNQRG